jgi:hypothetical protein
MDAEQQVLAEVAGILDGLAGDDLQVELLQLLARVHRLVARAADEPDTPENRARWQALYDELAELARVLEGEGP